MKNTPYVKQYDENGIAIPITGYVNQFPNRKQRREHKNRPAFFGNGKNFPLTIVKVAKYKRVRQIEFDKEGNKKIIEHYLMQ